MDTSNEERKIFSEIQKRLFYMIPQKWDAIYLFASIIEESFKKSQGEMFFYYYPKGILKKNPINVYEIPALFNIDEETYNELINKLFLNIKELHEISRVKHPMMWTSITIIIEGANFRIEYNYDDNEKREEFNPYERHVIWRYEYLGIDTSTMTKEEKEIINRYKDSFLLTRKSKDVYVEGMYKQVTHNIIDYAKTISVEAALALNSGDGKKKVLKPKLDLLKKRNKKEEQEENLENASNQILIGMKKTNENDDFTDGLLTSEVMSNRKNIQDYSIYIKDEDETRDNNDDDIEDGLLTSEVMTKRVKKKKD